MNIFLKVGFFVLVLIFGFMLILPAVEEDSIGVDIVFFGQGEADSMLIKNKDGAVLIDTGYREGRESLGDKLKTLGVKKLDYLILTHPDKDHIGGASYIIDNFQVDNLIQSKLVRGTKSEARIERSLEGKDLEVLVLQEDYDFQLGDLDFSILAPKKETYKDSNDYSLLTLVRDRELVYLFGGDAEKALLGETLERELPKVDFYKLPHHGRWNKNSEEMIQKISPRHTVITSKSGDERIIQALEKEGSSIHYAFERDIHFYSDGETIGRR